MNFQADTSILKLEVSFVSGNNRISAWVFKPNKALQEKYPAIVMGPGFSGTIDCNYQFYAERIAAAGFVVLLFDYPNFGGSSGAIRQEAEPWTQIQAYRDGISYLTTMDDINPSRIGVWGGSYSGGHVLVVSATDKRVKCMVAMTPFISGTYYLKQMPAANKQFLQGQFNADRASRVMGGKPATIPVVAENSGEFCAIPGKKAWNFVASFKPYAHRYQNAITLKSLEMQLEYEPGAYISSIDSIPKLFIIAKNDEMVPEALILDAVQKATEPKQLAYIDGFHFSPYMEKLSETCDLTISWFKMHL